MKKNTNKGVLKLQMQALFGEMRHMLRAEIEPTHEKLDWVETGTPRGQQQNLPNRQQGGYDPWRNEADSEKIDEPYMNRGRFQCGNENRGARKGRPRRDNDLRKIKLKNPSFQGKK